MGMGTVWDEGSSSGAQYWASNSVFGRFHVSHHIHPILAFAFALETRKLFLIRLRNGGLLVAEAMVQLQR